MDIASVPPASAPPSTSIPSVNGSVMNQQAIPVGNIPPATVKVEPNSVTPMVSGSPFPHISSDPRVTSQGVPSLQTSSLVSASQEMISNNDNVQDLKPMVRGISHPLCPVGPAAANGSILNNLSQAQETMNSTAPSGGTSIGLQSIGGNSMAMHMSNMISSGMVSSVPAAQTVLSSGQSGMTSVGGSGMLAGTAQVAQASGSFTSATSNMSGNSNFGVSEPVGNLQGCVSMGQSVTGMSQGNIVSAQMVQIGNGMNQNMMSGLGPSGMSSGTGTMIPTPGETQQFQQGMQSLGVNNNSAANMPMSQQTSSSLQSAKSKYVKVWEGNLSGQRQGQSVYVTRLEGYRSVLASETLTVNWPPSMLIVRLLSQDHMNKFTGRQFVGKVDFLVFRALYQHGFLGQLQEMKLCGVIQLPSQTLLLSVSDKVNRLIGLLLPGGMVVFNKPELSGLQPQQQQLHHQVLQLQQQLLQMQQQQQLLQMQQLQLPQMQQPPLFQLQQQQQIPHPQQQQFQPQQLPQIQQQVLRLQQQLLRLQQQLLEMQQRHLLPHTQQLQQQLPLSHLQQQQRMP